MKYLRDTCTLGFGGGGILPSDGAYVILVTFEVVTPISFPFIMIYCSGAGNAAPRSTKSRGGRSMSTLDL